MTEPFHIPMSRWCEHANEHIEDLEAENEKLTWMLDRVLADAQDRDTPMWYLNEQEYITDLDARWEARVDHGTSPRP